MKEYGTRQCERCYKIICFRDANAFNFAEVAGDYGWSWHQHELLCDACLPEVDPGRGLAGSDKPNSLTLLAMQVEVENRWGFSAYGDAFMARADPQRDADHAMKHIAKALGKLSGASDDFDHTNRDRYNKKDMIESNEAAEAAVADLLICAARVASTWPGGPMDLDAIVARRLAKKFPTVDQIAARGVAVDPPSEAAHATPASPQAPPRLSRGAAEESGVSRPRFDYSFEEAKRLAALEDERGAFGDPQSIGGYAQALKSGATVAATKATSEMAEKVERERLVAAACSAALAGERAALAVEKAASTSAVARSSDGDVAVDDVPFDHYPPIESEPYSIPTDAPYIQTSTGRRLYPLQARAEDICIEDIAHSLSNQCRFGGHCSRFYSVAEHCYHATKLARMMMSVMGKMFWQLMDNKSEWESEKRYKVIIALEVLLHDAAEAGCVDLPSPLKRVTGMEAYAAIEDHFHKIIRKRFALPHAQNDMVPLVDSMMLVRESRALLKNPIVINGMSEFSALETPLQYWSPPEAKRKFMELFRDLWSQRMVLEPGLVTR